MAASQAFKNRMNMRIDALKSQKGKISSKLKEANLKVRAQRAMHTTGAFIGGGAAAVLDYEVEGFSVMETEIPLLLLQTVCWPVQLTGLSVTSMPAGVQRRSNV